MDKPPKQLKELVPHLDMPISTVGAHKVSAFLKHLREVVYPWAVSNNIAEPLDDNLFFEPFSNGEYLAFWGTRIETDEEYNSRLASEAHREQVNTQDRYRRYLALKKEFEGKEPPNGA